MTPAKKRQRREYLRLLDKSKEAAECAIDNFNRAKGAFSTEATLMLLGVAWELLAKAILVHAKKTIKERFCKGISLWIFMKMAQNDRFLERRTLIVFDLKKKR